MSTGRAPKWVRKLSARRADARDAVTFLLDNSSGYHRPEYGLSYAIAFAAHALRSMLRILSPRRLFGSPVIVVGIHRSGTSLVAELLRLNGLYVGRHIHTGGRRGGYAENRLVIMINDYLLYRRGSTFLDPRDATPSVSWAERWFFRLLMKGEFLSRETNWGFKDPRTVLALDVWLSMFPRARVVLVTRGYSDVVRSAVRNVFAPTESEVDAILRRYARSLERIPGNEAIAATLRYEDIVGSSPGGILREAVTTLGLTFDEDSLALIGRPTGGA